MHTCVHINTYYVTTTLLTLTKFAQKGNVDQRYITEMRIVKGKCVVKNCENAKKQREERGEEAGCTQRVTYHRFPKDLVRRQKWVLALQLQAKNITNNHRVCSNHFLENVFDRSIPQKVTLRESAVPFTVYQNCNQVESENDSVMNSTNCKLEVSHFSAERISEYPVRVILETNECSLKRSPSPSPKECEYKRLKTEEENLVKVEREEQECASTSKRCVDRATSVSPERKVEREEQECASTRKRCVDRATSVSPERIFNSPTKKWIRKNLQEKIRMERKEKKRICNKLRVAHMKIASMEKVMAELKKKQYLTENQLEQLEEIGKSNTDLLKRQVRKVKHESVPRVYSPELRAFALALRYYSPAAYVYLRRKFHSALPHPKTISKWYRVVNGEPGICSEAIETLNT